MKHRVLAVAIAAASLSIAAPTAFASGYKLNEQSAAGAGTAYAGRAAVVQDASVVFYNPAGMVKLERAEVSAGSSYLHLSGEFSPESYKNAAGQEYTAANMGDYTDGGDFLSPTAVPFGYFAMPINDKFAAGFGVFVPFATNTDYDDDFIGGALADQTKVTSVEFQPAIAYRVNDQFSVGFGLDITYMKGLLSKQVDTVPYNENLKFLNGNKNPAHAGLGFAELNDQQWAGYEGFENHYEVEGDDWQLGYNLSMMWDVTSNITLGVTYRSEMKFKLKGDSKFKQDQGVVGLANADAATAAHPNVNEGDFIIGPVDGATGSVPKQGSEVPITTPQSLTVSYAHQLTNELQLVAGVTWTQWSVFKDFDVKSTEPGVIESLSDLGPGYIGHIEENWNDTTAVAVGANYQLNDDWLLRAGYANDQSPVSNTYRTARVPDNDRQWLSTGVNYRISNDLDVDFAFSYMFFDDVDVNEYNRGLDGAPKDKTNLKGEYSMDAMGLSFQVNYKL